MEKEEFNVKKKTAKKDYGFLKKDDQEEDSAWLLTYADLMTLLLTFFIFLLSISSPDTRKYHEMMRRLGDAFGAGEGAFEVVEEETLESVMNKIEGLITRENLERDIILTQDPRGIVLYSSNDIVFEPGKTVILEDTKLFLDNVSQILKNVSYKIIVEGHTDDVPIQTREFPSNWELSANRASAVVRYLIATDNIAPSRLIPAGYADVKPRFPPTPENRMRNSRIEFIVLREKF